MLLRRAITTMQSKTSPPSPSNMLGAVPLAKPAPLGVSFDQKLRSLLDVVDGLRSLGVSEEGINLPTIVVVGDQSSGKSSVLEGLSGVELPKGQGIVTRVPLILRLQASSPAQGAKITVSYSNEQVEISERDIASTLSSLTDELAGGGKAIADNPITMTVSRPGAPNLTLIDLPGITRVPVHGQPDNISQIIKDLIMHYIEPEETIILNVLSAAIDFSVCESIRMSQQVDKMGKRTLAVVTKVDMCPDGLLQKITDDAVKIGLGYICVRNRTTAEASFEEAEEAQRALFSSHRELKKLSKSMVGIEALANRLVQLQTKTIAGVLPNVLHQIDKSLTMKREQLQQLREGIGNVTDASVAFFNVASSVKRSLEGTLLAGDELDDLCATANNQGTGDAAEFHYTASLHAEFEKFHSEITCGCGKQVVRLEGDGGGYLNRIQRLLSECVGTNLPNVVPQSVIEKMVRQLVDSIAVTCTSELPSFVHDAARKVVFSVVAKHVGRFPNLKRLYTAAFQRALGNFKSNCFTSITRRLEMEKAVIYTTNAQLYSTLVNTLMRAAAGNLQSPRSYSAEIEGLACALDMMHVGMTGEEALKVAACSVLAYWIILSLRLADDITHELRFSANEAVLSAADEVVAEVAGNLQGAGMQQRLSIQEIMEEQPEVALERLRLRKSMDVLSSSKDLVTRVVGDELWETYGSLPNEKHPCRPGSWDDNGPLVYSIFP